MFIFFNAKMSRGGRKVPTGRLSAFVKRVEELSMEMQLFCLNPSAELFREICSCHTIKRRNENDFDIWKTAVMYKYGRDWDLASDPDDPKKILDLVEMNFELKETQLCKRAIEQPSQSLSINILHIFFATGELKYIDLFYQCMGHEKLALPTRQHLVSIYKDVRGRYRERILLLVENNPCHFDNLDIVRSVVDFSHFDNVKETAIADKKRIEEHNKIVV